MRIPHIENASLLWKAQQASSDLQAGGLIAPIDADTLT